MSRRKKIWSMSASAVAILMLVSACGSGGGDTKGSSSGPADFTVGAPVPLTGPTALTGQQMLSGIKYAAQEFNDAGGLDGAKVKVLEADTTGEPNRSATVATKLVSQDGVDAIVGGFGSTADLAMMQALRAKEPVVVHAGSSSVKIEKAVGAEDWYFHVYPWDYYRQEAAATFLESLNPKPKTVAIAYEDGLYGSDSNESAKKYFGGKFDIVVDEPFKTGSADFSAILNRVKAENADVLFVVGYGGDNVKIVQQVNTLGIKLSATLVLANGQTQSDYGDSGEGLFTLDTWSANEKVEGLESFIEGYKKFAGAETAQSPVVQGYTAMKVYLDAVKKAGSVDKAKVEAALGEMTFTTPYGEVDFNKSEEGGTHQLLTSKNFVTVQYQGTDSPVVWPKEVASAESVYPAR